jgi:NADH-quinone oxidoreductase subunit L
VHFDVQDIRNLGGLKRKLPFTFSAMVISAGALAGLPFFSGFISKEAIFTALNVWKGESLNIRWVIFALAFIVSALTVLYTFRLITKIFLGEETATQHLEIEEPPYIMRVPVFILAAGSFWLVAGINPFASEGWLISQAVPHSIMLTIGSIVWILAAFMLAFILFRKNIGLTSAFLKENFYFDFVYQKVVVSPVMIVSLLTEKSDRRIIDRLIHATAYVHVLGSHLIAWFDRAIIDGAVNGAAYVVRLLGSFTRSFQGGKIQVYVFWTTFTIIIFLIWSLI